MCCRVETERAEWIKDRDERLENMTTKLKELKAVLKERNRAVEELEKQLTEQNTALEAGRTRVAETEATAAELRTKLAETRRTVDERDEQLMKLQDELTAVCVCLSVFLLADRTNGRPYATVLRLSVICRL